MSGYSRRNAWEKPSRNKKLLKSDPHCADLVPKARCAFLGGKAVRKLTGASRSGRNAAPGDFAVGFGTQLGISPGYVSIETRRHRRHKLEVEIRVYPRNSPVVRGYTVDISESGISAMLRVEVPLGEVVRLEFKLPAGEVDVHALVRQRNAFRYGFQFVEASSAQTVIGRTCRQLALEQPSGEQP